MSMKGSTEARRTLLSNFDSIQVSVQQYGVQVYTCNQSKLMSMIGALTILLKRATKPSVPWAVGKNNCSGRWVRQKKKNATTKKKSSWKCWLKKKENSMTTMPAKRLKRGFGTVNGGGNLCM